MTTENTTPLKPKPGVAAPDTPAGMPLGARRLVMIGGLCVPVGLVGGSYLFGAQLLALAGVVMVAVALSYRADGPWFWRLSWVTAAAGALWMAFTGAYWVAVIAAADSSAALPGYAPVLFTAGAACVAVMAVAAVAAVAVRMLRASPRSARGA